jgi:hypothetical protein
MKRAVQTTAANLPARALLDWEQILQNRLPLYGHRNWLVVADSAYPAQSRGGIETIVARADQLVAVKIVLSALRACRHVKPIVYTDQELQFVAEQDAPGISAYRDRLGNLLAGLEVNALAHAEMISKLDHAAQTFHVMVIKTNMTIPYTSVFFELDCAYWQTDAETRLRCAMRAESGGNVGQHSARGCKSENVLFPDKQNRDSFG